jgi:hypothetical protein
MKIKKHLYEQLKTEEMHHNVVMINENIEQKPTM